MHFFRILFVAVIASTLVEIHAQDGLRKVEARRYGIQTRVPQAWTLIDWGTNEKAFVLSLPQAKRSSAGQVACELGVAPESLEEFRKRHQANDEAEQKLDEPRRKLIENRPAKIAAGQWLVSTWQHTDEKGTRFEVRARVISHDTLYTFSLTSDEAHYDAYRADFEEMLERAVFTPPETGLQRLPGGYWLQRDF